MKNFFGIGILVCWSIIFALTGCNRGDIDESHNHDHGELITGYSDNFELYGEVMPLVVGEEGVVLAHITRLEDFKPLDSAEVTMILKVGGEEQRLKLDAPQQAGIYRFGLKPHHAGVGSLAFEIESRTGVERLSFDHVHVYASHKALHEDEHSHGEVAVNGNNAILFTKEQSWKVDFGTEVVSPQCFGRVIKTTAQILPSQGDEREVSAKASGIIVFNNPNLVEGTKVGRGQKLFSIESSGMADNNMGVRFREAAASYTMAKDEYERKQKLVKDKIVTEGELQRARMELETAQAVYDNLKNNFSVDGEFVSAPLSGYVQRILVKNGSYVEAGQSIMAVSQNRDLFVRAEVSPRYYQDLAAIVGANMQLMNDERVYDLKELGGELVSYGRSAEVDNPLIPVTFKFRNTVDVVSGGFVTLYIRTQSSEEVIVVRNSGIVEEMGAHFVYVQITPELFEKRLVELGATDGVSTVIKRGVKVGERVVSKGAIMVKLAQASGALDPHAGHVH